MASPKEHRLAPTQVFENYTLSHIVGSGEGLLPIAESAFTTMPADATGPNLNVGGAGGYSEIVPIGFDLEFDNKTFSHMVAGTYGFVILCDSAVSSSLEVSNQVFSASSESPANPYVINPNIETDSTVLIPWNKHFFNMHPTVDTLGLTGDQETQLARGLAHNPRFNETAWGCKIFRETNSNRGRHTVIRWHVELIANVTVADMATRVAFEVVLYENGAIEYRYAPQSDIVDIVATPSTGGADIPAGIGVFTSGSNRFRDFSYGLGYRDEERDEYRYGGAVYDASFVDSWTVHNVEIPYAGNLDLATHWPGGRQGSRYVFKPPVNRRKVLPYREIRKQSSRIVGSPGYDDRRTIPFVSGVLVNYPTTLQRSYASSHPGALDRLDLYAGDFDVTGAISRYASDAFVGYEESNQRDPFSEASRQDQGPLAPDTNFFTSGSTDEFQQPTRSKLQVRMSLPVNTKTTMFDVTSSILYYNNGIERWEISTASMQAGGDSEDSTVYAETATHFDDHRGFGPIGNQVASGNLGLGGSFNGRAIVGNIRGFDHKWVPTWLSPSYGQVSIGSIPAVTLSDFSKSIAVNDDYTATTDETFELPINAPFVIEKAVIELPLECGDGWFKDKTTVFNTLHDGSQANIKPADFAGPALTVALFNQVRSSGFSGDTTIGSRRELIMTGTITHEFDHKSELVISSFQPLTSTYQLRQEGFLSFASPVAAVVSASMSSSAGGYMFTGSVAVPMEAAVTNGIVCQFMSDYAADPYATYGALNRSKLLNLIRTEKVPMKNLNTAASGDRWFSVSYVDGLGRAQTGFDQSARSVTGKECATFQTHDAYDKGLIPNPFYIPTGSITGQLQDAIDTGESFWARAMVPIMPSFRSPYLVQPGDKLVLAVAKTRPYHYSVLLQGESHYSQSVGHDIKLGKGAINITLYGSYVREGEEYQPGQNHSPNSPIFLETVSDVLGDDPIVDQFEGYYSDEYVGGLSDDYVTGSLVSRTVAVDGTQSLITGSRGRRISKYNARGYENPTAGDSQSLSFQLQPWFERAGSPRVSPAGDASERYWDSMMPSFSDALAADENSTGIFLLSDAYVGAFFPGGTLAPSGSVGWMMFNWSDVGFPTNWDWQMAHPFEPRYAGIPRLDDFSNSFICTHLMSAGSLSQIPPKSIDGIMMITVQVTRTKPGFDESIWERRLNSAEWGDFYTYSDIKASVTGSMSRDDMARFLYGYGDVNTRHKDGEMGATNFPDRRRSIIASDTDAYKYTAIGPIIRGWKYGVHSGLPTYSRAYFRRSRYGQFRDMLEQRPLTKYYNIPQTNQAQGKQAKGVLAGVVEVRFMNVSGNITSPENTSSQNLDLACTSSLPYFDGLARSV